jgi:nucleoside-diphosphate-sugar epimerase
MPNVLITGGLGYVGSHLVEQLKKTNNEITLLVRESDKEHRFGNEFRLATIEEIEKNPENLMISTVVNLAGKYSFDHQVIGANELLLSNVVLPARVAAAVSGVGAQVHWVQASTFMQHYKGADRAPTCFYASTKQSVEDVLHWFESEDFRVTSLVLPHIFGEEDPRDKLINLLLRSVKSGSRIQLSSGTQVMDLVHISDITKAIEMVLVDKGPAGRWQITSGKAIRVAEIIEYIRSTSGNALNVQFDESLDRAMDCYELWLNAPILPNWTASKELFSWLSTRLAS